MGARTKGEPTPLGGRVPALDGECDRRSVDAQQVFNHHLIKGGVVSVGDERLGRFNAPGAGQDVCEVATGFLRSGRLPDLAALDP